VVEEVGAVVGVVRLSLKCRCRRRFLVNRCTSLTICEMSLGLPGVGMKFRPSSSTCISSNGRSVPDKLNIDVGVGLELSMGMGLG